VDTAVDTAGDTQDPKGSTRDPRARFTLCAGGFSNSWPYFGES